MTDSSPDLWLEHLERVLRLSEERELQLNADDHREIARELGISDADIEAAAALASDHATRGQGYADKKLWNDAVDELRHALALDPTRDETVIALAEAYAGRHAETGEERDSDEARRLARFALQRDPDNSGAFSLLERLQSDVRIRKVGRQRVILAAAVAGVTVLGAGAFVLSGQAMNPEVQAEDTSGAPPVKETDPPTPSSSESAPLAESPKTTPPILKANSDGECPARMRLEPGKGCVPPTIVVEPGVGLEGLVVGESSPEDVFAVYGRDAKIHEFGGQIRHVNYGYDGSGEYRAGRSANITRPSDFAFSDGVLEKITVGNYNRAIETPEGIETNNSTLDDVLAAYGQHYQRLEGDILDTYRYEQHGIEFYVNREDRRVTALFIIRKRR